jgi:outer membrane protein assembly factor BamA
MNIRWALPLAFALLADLAVFAETEVADETVNEERDFDLPMVGTEAMGDSLNLTDVEVLGGPLKKLGAKWPEDLVIAPIPGYSPQLGWNLTLGGGYFLNNDDKNSKTPPSVVGGFVMGAENGSYAYGGGANLHLLDDRFRLKLGAAYVDIRYQFYGIGNEQNDSGIRLDLLQSGPMYFASGSLRVWKKLYLGLGYLSGDIDTRLRLDIPEQPFFDPTFKLDLAAITIPIEIDSRDHEQFPRDGWLVKARGVFYRESVGSEFEAETFKIVANHYLPMRDQDVLASRIIVKGTSEDTPFFLLSTFGGSSDLRGYPSGRYRDRMMYAMQSEYRWHYRDRWILTGFVGFGEVAESFSKFGKNFLPAGGVGARYVLSEKHRVSLSADIAVGNDGTEFYFGVGEAF